MKLRLIYDKLIVIKITHSTRGERRIFYIMAGTKESFKLETTRLLCLVS
jgi:hypothetical protein